MRFITWADYLLLPVYLFIIYRIAILIRNTYYPEGHPWRPYFMPGITVKILGALFIGIVYQYYYGGGDTSQYFYHAKVINSAYSESVVKWWNLLFHIPQAYEGGYVEYTSLMEWYNDKGSYMVCTVTAFINVFTFNTYLATSCIFAALSFTGMWALFRTFAQQYPHLVHRLALAILFVPSCFIWGSGIFKDTICMFALGWLTYSTFQVLIRNNFSIRNILVAILSFYILLIIKIYILISFLPALVLWIMFLYSHRMSQGVVRVLLKLGVVMVTAVLFLYFYNEYGAALGKYSLDNLARTSYVTRDWIAFSSGDEGSAYDLGDFDPTLWGILQKFPLAVNVTLFRPYLWEARKPLVFLNALEAFVFLFITLKILFTIGLVNVWRSINEDPNIQFCLIFTLVFAFAVGISTYNFGALSRYRIPCIPMYAIALVLIYYKHNPPEKNILSWRR